MRFLGWVAGFSLAFPALVPAQVIKRQDIVGTWLAQVEYTSPERRAVGMAMTPVVHVTFWADGMFMFEDVDTTDGLPGTHGSGRWRLSGDTLWWGTDWRYGSGVEWMLYGRGELPEGPVTDTLEWKNFPANDSLFWTAPLRERKGMPEGGYWHLTVYKISIKDDRLTMVRIGDLSNNDWDPPRGVYERKK